MTGIERLVDIVNDGPYSGGVILISVQKLREICEQIEREADDISGYESDVLAFVEERGGMEAIKERLRESVPLAIYDRKNRRIWKLEKELEDMRGRLMPEGIKWPMFEDNELVGFGDEYVNAKGNVSTLRTIVIKDCRDRLGGGYYWKLGKGACAVVVKNGERIKRPPVLAADGKPLEVGQTVWGVNNGMEFTVSRLPKPGEYQAVKVRYRNGSSTSFDPDQLTHQRPVLDADGVPIKKGDEVYLTDEAWVLSEVPSVKGEPLVVTNFKYNRECPVCAIDQFDIENGITVPMRLKPGWVTHTKPEPDSWDSVWMDVSNGGETPQGMRRRCQALDGVSE